MVNCFWTGEACPVECNSAQTECWVDSFDSAGLVTDSVKECFPLGTSCPCGSGQHKCTVMDQYFSSSWCQPSSMSCPVNCNHTTQEYCNVQDALLDGSFNMSAAGQESCVAKGTACPCGANMASCSSFDSWRNKTMHWCQTTMMDGLSNPCPVTCSSTQQMCLVSSYDVRETCSATMKSVRIKTDPVSVAGTRLSAWKQELASTSPGANRLGTKIR